MVNPVRDVPHICRTFAAEYNKITNTKLRLIDSYTALCVATALIQHAYMILVGSFPFNAYLAAVIGCIGSAVFSVCLRMQLDDAGNDLPPRAPERAYADFILAHLTLFFLLWNYMG